MSDTERDGLEALRDGRIGPAAYGFDMEEVKASATELVALGATVEEAFSLGLLLGCAAIERASLVQMIDQVAESVRSPVRGPRPRRAPRRRGR